MKPETIATLPLFRSTEFLTKHIQSILSFYYPKCIDDNDGGYYQQFESDGSANKGNYPRHLVSSSRLTINFAVAAKQFNDEKYLEAARHGIQYLRSHHLNSQTGGYAWLVENTPGHGRKIVDTDNYCYGIAFVLMAYARTYEAGAKEMLSYINETFELMEKYFWSAEHELYVDVIDGHFTQISPYRGQNANMHCCEAMISVFEATGNQKFLNKALTIAHKLTVELSKQCGGMIWEHYDENWQADFKYNEGDTEHKLRPWGYQPGHFTEWAKLLLIIHRYHPEAWLMKTAKALFDKAMEVGFDKEYGGLFYGFSPEGQICSNGKYSWVQAETIAAAAMLAEQFNNGLYACIYQQLWHYAWQHMIDHQHKCWHRNLTHDNKVFVSSSVAMGRTDYHSICACIEIIKTFRLK